jgi:hypothetical protein
MTAVATLALAGSKTGISVAGGVMSMSTSHPFTVEQWAREEFLPAVIQKSQVVGNCSLIRAILTL